MAFLISVRSGCQDASSSAETPPVTIPLATLGPPQYVAFLCVRAGEYSHGRLFCRSILPNWVIKRIKFCTISCLTSPLRQFKGVTQMKLCMHEVSAADRELVSVSLCCKGLSYKLIIYVLCNIWQLIDMLHSAVT